LSRKHKLEAARRRLKFGQLHMPASDTDALRRHGLHELVDRAENPVLAPAYARQSQYWLSVLGEPVIPDFQQPELGSAREFEFDPEANAELPDADLPLLTDIFVDLRHRRCLSECGHAACTARSAQAPGLIYRHRFRVAGA
jgi:hypothetical protein